MQKKRLQYIALLLFLTCFLNLCVPCLPVRAEVISLLDSLTGSVAGSFTEAEAVACSSTEVFLPEESNARRVSFCDIAGHWAEVGIKEWTVRELAGGYPDGTFRPNSPIARAEFVTLVNRVFGYSNMADMVYMAGVQTNSPDAYGDVAKTDWYANEITKAAAVGYLGGYPDGTVKLQNPITRQEVAAILAKIMPTAAFENINNDKNGKIIENSIKEFTDEALPDYYYHSRGDRIALVGGCWNSGGTAGLFSCTIDAVSSSKNEHLSARILLIP